MTASIPPELQTWVHQWHQQAPLHQADPHPWLHGLRQQGMGHLIDLNWPTRTLESWKHTHILPVVEKAFTPVPPNPVPPHFQATEACALPHTDTLQLVFINGCFAPHLSYPTPADPTPADPTPAHTGLWVGSFTDALKVFPKHLEPHLGKLSLDAHQSFAALNTAYLQEGTFVYVPARMHVQTPVELVFMALSPQKMWMAHPRILIVLEESSQAYVIERYIYGNDATTYLCNPVTEVYLYPNACLHYALYQNESPGAYHIHTMGARLDKDSQLHAYMMSTGALISRQQMHVRLAAPGANCHIRGLYVGRDRQHAAIHTHIDHSCRQGVSKQHFKGILDDQAQGAFYGTVHVHPHAIKTDAQQLSNSLLLCPQALAYAQPHLEILADDVKCAHGATVGPLDEAALFYLRSRGLEKTQAQRLLTYAFANAVLESLPWTSLRDAWQGHARHWLGVGDPQDVLRGDLT